MGIYQIDGSNLDPNVAKLNNKANNVRTHSDSGNTEKGHSPAKDSVQLSKLAQYTQLTLSSQTPLPNQGRLEEIQKAIESGFYNSKPVLDETASAIVDQLLR